MTQYIIRRVLSAIPVVVGISILVFSMMHLLPGDPVDSMTMEQRITPETRAAIRKELGLDQPIVTQYVNYVKGVLRGDLGRSIRSRRPVWDEIRFRYMNTLKLAVTSLVVAILVGVGAGVLAARYKDSWLDNALMVFCLIGISVPSFWLGLLMIYLFVLVLGVLPIAAPGWQGLVMPSVALGFMAAASTARMTRSAMLDVMRADYVTTARSKGAPENRVLFKHALKNALIPVLTIIGLVFGDFLGGAFIVESVFAYNGLGALGVSSIMTRDFPITQGIILIDAITVVVISLIVDIIYSFVDPRIAYK